MIHRFSKSLSRTSNKRIFAHVAFGIIISLLIVLTAVQCPKTVTFDIILRNGMIYDGSGGPPFRGDLAIKGDRIAAVGNLNRAKAREVIDVHGNAIAPGFIETRLTDAMPFAIREVARRLSALGQGGQPEDVAQVITFLATPGAQGVTGAVVRVCGGAFVGA